MMSNPLLINYSVLILDEIHERSLMTDILMGLVKKILKVFIIYILILLILFIYLIVNNFQKRPTLRLIILSATMDSSQLKSYFNFNQTNNPDNDTATVLGIEGKSYPTKMYYLKGDILNKYLNIIILKNI